MRTHASRVLHRLHHHLCNHFGADQTWSTLLQTRPLLQFHSETLEHLKDLTKNLERGRRRNGPYCRPKAKGRDLALKAFLHSSTSQGVSCFSPSGWLPCFSPFLLNQGTSLCHLPQEQKELLSLSHTEQVAVIICQNSCPTYFFPNSFLRIILVPAFQIKYFHLVSWTHLYF